MLHFLATWPDGSVAEFQFAYAPVWGFERIVAAMHSRAIHHYGRDPLAATWQVIPEPHESGAVVMAP